MNFQGSRCVIAGANEGRLVSCDSCPGDMGTLLLPLNLVLHPAVYECINLPPSMLLPNPIPS